ncbi:MAG TPA: YceI family protein [Polyangia bacterium]|nr:YceI family protein [Polyangia bacterium]
MAEWTIDPARSSIGFSVRHMVISKVRGRFTRFAGTFTLDDADPARSTAEARIQVASVETGDRERDEYLRTSDFLDPARHPEIVFKSRRVERAGRGLILVGDLTIRGVTREVSLQVNETARARDRVGFQAKTTIDRRNFDLRWGQLVETGGVVVGDKLEIAIAVEATPRSAT